MTKLKSKKSAKATPSTTATSGHSATAKSQAKSSSPSLSTVSRGSSSARAQTARTSPSIKVAARRPRKPVPTYVPTDAQRLAHECQVREAFYRLSRQAAARALCQLEASSEEPGIRSPHVPSETPSDAPAADAAPSTCDAEKQHKTLAEIFALESCPATAPAQARDALAALWQLPLSRPPPNTVITSSSAEAIHTCAPPVTEVAQTKAEEVSPARRFAEDLAQRVRHTAHNHIRLPWPYHLSPQTSKWCCLPAPPMVMTPALWHPQDPLTCRAYMLLHMSSSGLATVRGVETEGDHVALGSPQGHHVGFFDLCGFTP